MPFPRAAGVHLHPTSLPGPFGIGDLGPAAYRFVDFLVAGRQRLWQVNPLGPTGYGDSPYAGLSAFAGNPNLLSPELLLAADLLSPDDLQDVPAFPPERVDFGWIIPWKRQLLERVFARYSDGAAPGVHERVAAFRQAPAVRAWLDDYALFAALKERHGGAVWNTWGDGAARRDPTALDAWRAELGRAIDYHVLVQYLFSEQWSRVKAYANQHGIHLIGDIPIFVAYDSADVWAHPDLFELEADGSPRAVAGVPPDYFSATGQLWGNPLYDWPVLEDRRFAWWIERFRAMLRLVDAVRLDHFRGFESYWRVPAGETTAVNGQWVKCPGERLFAAVGRALGSLPIMAEDLGVITPQVEALREGFGFPGMKVLQFAFVEGSDGGFLPHRYPRNCVVYSGTHDNDTAVGWWATCPVEERRRVARYLGREPGEIHQELLRLALASVADTALCPLQDVLGLGSEARMNFPGRPAGNWTWRLADEAPLGLAAGFLAELAETYERA
ncbi:MAG: 4-alpha-glucanotransferase [Armatimonadetes bacterium]|nr:4-alpha-glucanotransferase [Armatimonadota bacterium]